MDNNGYAYQLRTLVELEKRNRKDYTARMQKVHSLRVASIDAMDVPEDQKMRLRERALVQFENFTNRTLPFAENS